MKGKTLEESKVGIASVHFDGITGTWHQSLLQEKDYRVIVRNWRAYKNLLRERFEEVLDDPIADLKELNEQMADTYQSDRSFEIGDASLCEASTI